MVLYYIQGVNTTIVIMSDDMQHVKYMMHIHCGEHGFPLTKMTLNKNVCKHYKSISKKRFILNFTPINVL